VALLQLIKEFYEFLKQKLDHVQEHFEERLEDLDIVVSDSEASEESPIFEILSKKELAMFMSPRSNNHKLKSSSIDSIIMNDCINMKASLPSLTKEKQYKGGLDERR
jgi:hypothetical protein